MPDTEQTALVSDEQLQTAAHWLAARDPALARACDLAGVKPWRSRVAGYEGLARIICFQQISTAAGLAIWKRVKSVLIEMDPETLLRTPIEELRACGLSRPKIAHMRAAAEACLDGKLDFERIAAADDDSARVQLCSIRGIGAWSADIYLMFALGRLDVFPAGDLALQEAWRRLNDDPERLSPRELLERSGNWRPYRSVAAHLLWSCMALGRKSNAW